MMQTEQKNNALRSRCVQPAAVHASAAAAQAESARAQAEQLSRKLAAARAEVRRYQTRMFAFERTLLALKHENAELEAACEQAREEAEQANARAERAEQARQEAEDALRALQQTAAQPEPEAPAQLEEAEPVLELPGLKAEPPEAEQETAACSTEPEEAAAPEQPAWQPRTELEHLSVELMNWFDAMMPQV